MSIDQILHRLHRLLMHAGRDSSFKLCARLSEAPSSSGLSSHPVPEYVSKDNLLRI
jgi:hypothetical protein